MTGIPNVDVIYFCIVFSDNKPKLFGKSKSKKVTNFNDFESEKFRAFKNVKEVIIFESEEEYKMELKKGL